MIDEALFSFTTLELPSSITTTGSNVTQQGKAGVRGRYRNLT